MILGIIPARGGSKGIPRKNIKLIAGKPLIAWTIEHAINSNLLDDFIVSTEDPDITEVAEYYGATVLPRPKELATDTSLIIDTLKYILEHYPADVFVLLQPTSPIRSPDLIDRCIEEYKKRNVDVVVTGFDCHYKPYETYVGRRQDLDTFFYNDGNVYVINTKLIKKGRINSVNYYPVYTSKEENVEIDDEFDFWLAEQILLKRRDKYGKYSWQRDI